MKKLMIAAAAMAAVGGAYAVNVIPCASCTEGVADAETCEAVFYNVSVSLQTLMTKTMTAKQAKCDTCTEDCAYFEKGTRTLTGLLWKCCKCDGNIDWQYALWDAANKIRFTDKYYFDDNSEEGTKTTSYSATFRVVAAKGDIISDYIYDSEADALSAGKKQYAAIATSIENVKAKSKVAKYGYAESAWTCSSRGVNNVVIPASGNIYDSPADAQAAFVALTAPDTVFAWTKGAYTATSADKFAYYLDEAVDKILTVATKDAEGKDTSKITAVYGNAVEIYKIGDVVTTVVENDDAVEATAFYLKASVADIAWGRYSKNAKKVVTEWYIDSAIDCLAGDAGVVGGDEDGFYGDLELKAIGFDGTYDAKNDIVTTTGKMTAVGYIDCFNNCDGNVGYAWNICDEFTNWCDFVQNGTGNDLVPAVGSVTAKYNKSLKDKGAAALFPKWYEKQ